VNAVDFLILALAAYRITRLIVEDTLLEPLRERVWKRFPPETKLGYLFTCFWCTGFWVSVLIVAVYLLLPSATIAIALVFALSAVVGIIDTILHR
jgi:hypothetical protein